MEIIINSAISGGSAESSDGSLREFLGCDEYESLLSQVRALFAEIIINKNINDLTDENGFADNADRKDLCNELFFADSDGISETEETGNPDRKSVV